MHSQEYYTAYLIARLSHKGQVDKSGKDYFLHPLYVSSLCKKEEEKIVALLHDVLEDCDVSKEELANIFSDTIIEALEYLTHQEGVEYFDYIQNIKQNTLATTVKKADLTHNMDLSRLDTITQKDLERVEKYKKAYKILEEE